MADPIAIRPGARIENARAQALLDTVASAIASYEEMTGETPDAVAFVLLGQTTWTTSFDILSQAPRVLAFSGALLTDSALGLAGARKD